MKRAVAMMLRYKKYLLRKIWKGESQDEIINSSLCKGAEIDITKMVEAKKFTAKTKSLQPRDCNSDVSRLKGNSKMDRDSKSPSWNDKLDVEV